MRLQVPKMKSKFNINDLKETKTMKTLNLAFSFNRLMKNYELIVLEIQQKLEA